MELKKERKMKDSTFARAYKFTGTSSSDKAGQRLKRRSVEQRDLRHDLIDQRRQIDLSPVNEGDSTMKDYSYKDKTPTKPKVDKRQIALQQVERLKLWKAEREEKRKKELEKQKKAPFRYRKMTHKDQEVFDIKKVPVNKSGVRHPVTQTSSIPKPGQRQPTKQTKANNKVTVKPVTIPVTAKSYEKPTMGSKLKSTVETKKGPNPPSTRQSRARDVKQQKPAPQVTRSTRSNRSVSTEAAKPLRTKRESSRNAAAPVIVMEQEPTPVKEMNLTKVSTARGCPSESTDSFAPNDFTFNTASFVFKPLSPNSAAGFLFPGQDTSCSFLEHNPKISSTPYREKRKARSICKEPSESTMTESPATNKRKKTQETETSFTNKSASIAVDVTVNADRQGLDDTLSVTAMDETVVSSSQKIADTDTTTLVNNRVDKPSTPLRRSSRRSVLSSTVIKENLPDQGNKEEDLSVSVIRSGQRSVRRSTRLSAIPDVSLDLSNSVKRSSRSVSMEQSQKELETSAKRTKRSKRKSVIDAPEKEIIAETVQETAGENDVFVPEINETEATCEVKATTEKKKKKVTLKEKFLSESDVDSKKTPGRQSTRNRSFAGFRLPDSECAVLSASAKRKRKSVMPKSPEEWVTLLSKSPMIEMTRRTPKLGNSSFTAIDFDDIDLNNSLVAENTNKNTEAADMPADPKMNLFQTLDNAEDGVATKDQGLVEKTNMEVTDKSDKSSGGTSANKDEGLSEETGQCTKEKSVDSDEAIPTDKKQETYSTELDTEAVQAEAVKIDVHEAVDSDVHDVKYFRRLLVSETDRLNSLCTHWEEINKANSLTEEVSGQIRTTVGQGVLLMNQRFKQFRGLVDNCEFNTGEKETTCTDLQGFWDMIYFQVEDVDAKFEQLKKLQANNWVDDTPKPAVKKVKKKVVKPVVRKPVKSKFAAFRAQMNKKVDTPEEGGAVEEKVFEMPNFFAISSPVKSPAIHCQGGSPRVSVPEPESKVTPDEQKKDTISLPSSAELLMRRTPARKSYAPVIPSPLLVDSTPKPRPRRSCTNKTPMSRQLLNDENPTGKDTGDGNTEKNTPVKRTPRRSVRARKSVNFAETAPEETAERLSVSMDTTDTTQMVDEEPANVSEEKFVDDDVFAMYLQPMSVLHGHSEKENSPSPAKRRKSSSGLKACPSSARRKSQSKKVHFNSTTNENSPSIKAPQTPFYEKTGEKRVTRRSLSQNVENQDSSSHTPQRDKRSRPSLLYTPPSDTHTRSPARPLTEVPTGILISFTP